MSPHNTKGSCNQCEHYGGWIPTMISVKRTWVYGWCLRARQLSTQSLVQRGMGLNGARISNQE